MSQCTPFIVLVAALLINTVHILSRAVGEGVNEQLMPPHAHPALTIQPTAPHSLGMHKKLNCILPPTPLWCSCQVTMIQTSQLPM